MSAAGTYCGAPARIGVKRTNLDRLVNCGACKAKVAERRAAAKARAAGLAAMPKGEAKMWVCRRCSVRYFGPVEAGGHTPPKCGRCGERSWRLAQFQAEERRV